MATTKPKIVTLYCEGHNCAEKVARKDAYSEGWRVIKGKDYCPSCAAKQALLKGRVPDGQDNQG